MIMMPALLILSGPNAYTNIYHFAVTMHISLIIIHVCKSSAKYQCNGAAIYEEPDILTPTPALVVEACPAYIMRSPR